MIYGANNDSCEKDSHSSSYSNLEDDSLMSLFAFPLPSLDQFDSFEYPFDDPSMEPLPLGSQAQVPALVHSSSDSNVMNESSSKKGPTGSTNSHVQDLINILNPLTSQTVVSKRSIEEAFFADDQVRGNKRQRTTCPMQAASRTPQEESTPRFRPYQETQWRAQFQKLVQYKLEHGHCSVPHAYPEDPILARWVKRQRYQYKKFNDNSPTSTMTTRRIQDLEAIGFVWHTQALAWQEKLNELRIFKQQKGHCNVPAHYPQNASLSTWVKSQRRQYKMFIAGSSSSTITMERLHMLESLGFVFDIQKSKQTIDF